MDESIHAYSVPEQFGHGETLVVIADDSFSRCIGCDSTIPKNTQLLGDVMSR